MKLEDLQKFKNERLLELAEGVTKVTSIEHGTHHGLKLEPLRLTGGE